MKYEVSHSRLDSPTRVFKQGEVATPEELAAAGFDVAFLLKNGAVEALKGTAAHDEVEPAATDKKQPQKHGKK